jgi:hypothetical protein
MSKYFTATKIEETTIEKTTEKRERGRFHFNRNDVNLFLKNRTILDGPHSYHDHTRNARGIAG